MAGYTHDYELKVGDHTFEGEVEISDAGIVAYTESGSPVMPKKTDDVLKNVLDILGTLPATYSDLKKFELTVKE